MRSFSTFKVRRGGGEQIPLVQGKEQQLRVPGCNGAGMAEKSYPSPRPGAATGRTNPMSKEQWLHFAGAAVNRYPTPKVRETQVRQ